MRGTEGSKQVPARGFFQDCVNVRQVWSIGHGRETVSEDGVQLSLCFLLYVLVKHHGLGGGVKCEGSLYRDGVRRVSHLGKEDRTHSVGTS